MSLSGRLCGDYAMPPHLIFCGGKSMYFIVPLTLHGSKQAHQEVWRGVLPQGLQTFWGPHVIFTLFLRNFLSCFFCFCFPLHCLDSMSESLGRLISNAFTVSVEIDGVNTWKRHH